MTTSAPMLFAPGSGQTLASHVATRLGIVVSAHEEREFEWGQHKSRPLEPVRGRDVFVLYSLHGDERHSVNDKLCRLLFFLGALRDAGAARVTAIMPFLCYTRKERRTQAWDPVITRYVAQLFEAVGVDRVATVEVHNVAAFENAFRCGTLHIDPAPLAAGAIEAAVGTADLAVMSPDAGGIKRARHFADVLGERLGRPIPTAFVEKHRSLDVVSGDTTVVGDVAERTVVLVDDLVVAGTTLARAAVACRAAGARSVLAVAAHGAFVPAASTTLARAPIDGIYVLDHIPPLALDPALARRIHLMDSSPLLADAIRELHAADHGILNAHA